MNPKLFLAPLASLLLASLLTPVSFAQALMIDFGPISVAGKNLTNSPLHTANDQFTDNVWNKVELDDIAAGNLKWSDNSVAKGVSLRLGGGLNYANHVSFNTPANDPNRSDYRGGAIRKGIYSGNSVGRDGISIDSAGSVVALQIGGLQAGAYNIYVTTRHTDFISAHSQNVYVGTTSMAANTVAYRSGTGTDTRNGFVAQSISYPNGEAATDTWVQGTNYFMFNVTIEAGEFLNIMTSSAGGLNKGSIASLQIVPINP